jgi:hypothetical protein
MGLEGLGLALGALGSGLGSIPEGSLKSTMEMPSYEEKVLANIKAQDAMNEFRQNAPLRAAQNEEALQTVRTRLPFTSQLVGADVATKLLAPKAAQAKIGLEEAQAAEHQTKADTGGFEIVHDKYGPRLVGKNPKDARYFGQDATFGGLRDLPLRDVDMNALRTEMSLKRAHIDYLKKQEQEFGKLSQSDKAKLDEDIRHHKMLEQLQQAKIDADKASTRIDSNVDVQRARMHEHFSNQVDKEIEAVRTGPLGKEKFIGLNPEVQHRIYEYMRNKILQGRIQLYNSSLGPDSAMRLVEPEFENDPALDALIKAGGAEPTWWKRNAPTWAGGMTKEELAPFSPQSQTPSLRYNPATKSYE